MGEGDGEGPLVDEDRLREFLAANLAPHRVDDFRVERHRGGHSNETFFVRWGGSDYVLRRPPRGAFLPTAHDVLREHRVLSAVHGTAVRAPRPVLACGDETVLGAPFYLMDRVHGHILRDRLPPVLDAPGKRERIGDELIDALAEIHNLHWLEAGLRGFAKPQGYLERQVRRWTGQMELTLPWTERARPVPELAEVGKWLAASLPVSPTTTLVHGDFKLDNVVLDDDGRLVAVLDWEMSTLGDPFADLGWLLSFWREDGDPTEDLLPVTPRMTELPGFRSRQDLIERYEARTGYEVGDLSFYEALAVWKLAILLEGSFARHLQGVTDDPFFAELRTGVPALARRALAIARRAPAR